MASSSLWTLYSMINSVTKAKYSVTLKNYPRVTAQLKAFDTYIKQKAKTFSKDKFDKFFDTGTLATPYWLVRKVR